MGCGASKEDILEPKPMNLLQSGRTTPQLMGQAFKAIQDANTPTSLLASYMEDNIYKEDTTPSTTSSDSEESTPQRIGKALMEYHMSKSPSPSPSPSSSKAKVEEEDTHGATALAVLTGELKSPDSQEEEEDVGDTQVVAISAGDVLVLEGSDQGGSISAIEMSGKALLDALVRDANKHSFCSDFPVAIGGMRVVSEPNLNCLVQTSPLLRKAEIIDPDDEPDGGATEEQTVVSLTEQPSPDWRPNGDEGSHSSPLILETRKSKLPLLTIASSALDMPVDPFVKTTFPITISKSNMVDQDLISPSTLSDLTTATDSEFAENTPDIAEKSALCDLSDPHIENIILAAQELDSPLISTLDCHGIHKDSIELISPNLIPYAILSL